MARRLRRYSWFSAHTQGVAFLGPLCSLMQNSYSKAALTPLGKLYCTYVSKGNAPPVPYDEKAAFEANMQVLPGPAVLVASSSDISLGLSVAFGDPRMSNNCLDACVV